jgi:hypothetical protein
LSLSPVDGAQARLQCIPLSHTMTNALTVVPKESKCLCSGYQGRSNWTYNRYQACTVTPINEINTTREPILGLDSLRGIALLLSIRPLHKVAFSLIYSSKWPVKIVENRPTCRSAPNQHNPKHFEAHLVCQNHALALLSCTHAPF